MKQWNKPLLAFNLNNRGNIMQDNRIDQIDERVKKIEQKIDTNPFLGKIAYQRPEVIDLPRPKISFGKKLSSPFRKSWYTPEESCNLQERGLTVSDINCKAKISFKIIFVSLICIAILSLLLASLDALIGVFPDWRYGGILTVIFFTALILLLPTLLFAFVGERHAKIALFIFVGLIVGAIIYISLLWNGVI